VNTVNITIPTPTNVTVTGPDSITVNTSVSGAFTGYYGLFISTSTQTSTGANQVNTATFTSMTNADGFQLVDSTRIRNLYGGTYFYTFSIIASKTDGGEDDIDIWLAKNGDNIANSNTHTTVDKTNGHSLITVTYLATMAANDDIRVRWSSADSTMRLLHTPAASTPTRPAVPSVIFTANQVR
jgi:hypothetical protein